VNTRFRESFAEDLSAIADAGRLRRIKRVIEQVEAARTFQDIPNLKRLDAKRKYYRIRVGDYRVGFVFEHGGSPSCAASIARRFTATFPEPPAQAPKQSGWAGEFVRAEANHQTVPAERGPRLPCRPVPSRVSRVPRVTYVLAVG
jgi:mRNA interferase RelE/StbE